MAKKAWILVGERDFGNKKEPDKKMVYFKGKKDHSPEPEFTLDVEEAAQFGSQAHAEACSNSPFRKYVAMEHEFV